ncbi:MAG TPA: redoxin family protein [Opitutales bacterium]|nr:redoxin family protein [Opitutales bacterium]
MNTHLRLLLLAAGTALCALAATTPATPGVKTGAPAPDFSLPGNDGKTYKLSDFKGKVVVLEWLNHLCPIDSQHYVGDEKGNMQTLQRFAKDRGVIWLSVISSAKGQQGYVDAKGATEDIAKFKAAPLAVLLDPDGKVGHRYDAKTTPHMFIINKDGLVVYQGGINDGDRPAADIPKAKPYFKNALEEVLAGKPVTLSDTKPYGCSVKYAN